MPSIRVNVDGDHEKVGREMGTDRLPVIHTTADWTIDAMEHGMQSGATSLMVLIPASVEGADVLVAAETSLTVFMMAATTLAATHREEVEQPGWAVLSPAARALLGPRFAEAIRRAVPNVTPDQANVAATMILDATGADAP